MKLSSDLLNIKDKYGERMMHYCRKNFPTILEEEGKIFELLSLHFACSRSLYEDIVYNSLEDNFNNYIYSLWRTSEELIEVPETVVELLSIAGYDLYECHTEEDIQSFKKYYAADEKLCSFSGGRLDKCYVFFVVKKNVNEIKRENFLYPQRQDEYGTSVISIQFTKGDINTLSIKNRYNHRVNNPDATYSNNLENIIPGLTRSFEREYNLKINQNEYGDFELPGYVKANDGKYYKYNYEINNIYYCPDNIIIDNFEVIMDYQEKEKYLIMDYFIIDLVNKKINLYDESLNDGFILDLENIKKIEIIKSKDTGNKKIHIILNDETYVDIEIDINNRIISYSNKNIAEVQENFLFKNKYLKSIDIPNVKYISNCFLSSNNVLEEICLDNVLKIGNDFLLSNTIISSIDAPKLCQVGNYFLTENKSIYHINMPNLISVGDYFLSKNILLTNLNMPNLINVGSHFLQYNMKIEELYLPSLVNVENHFMTANKIIKKVILPKLDKVGDNFLYCNKTLTELNLEKLEIVGNHFLHANKSIVTLNLPKLRFAGLSFLHSNKNLISLMLPELCQVLGNFLYENNSLIELYAPKLISVGDFFLFTNKVLRDFDLSSLEEYNKQFCNSNPYVRRRILNCC